MKLLPIMSIDAAFANTGIAIGHYNVSANELTFERLDLVQTAADKISRKVVRRNSDDLRRARQIHTALHDAIGIHKPAFVFCEVPSGTKSGRSAWALGIAVGLIASVAQVSPLIQVSPKEVKEAVTRATGDMQPDKEQIIAWAAKAYPHLNWPTRGNKIVAGKAEHMADAVAAAHAGIASDSFRESLAMIRPLL